jgi:hypothetical protein
MTETVQKYEPRFQFPRDLVAAIEAFETGDIERDDMVDLFQHLIDTGLVWQLQGFYGRTAADLIHEGYCHA